MLQTYAPQGGPALGRTNLPRLRQALASRGLDGFVVPHEDEWQNEYVPEAYDRLAWLTGFTGSAGAAVVLTDKAAVFVDGRYTLQVRAQVDEACFAARDLVEEGAAGWLQANAKPGAKIGYDPKLHSPDALARIQAGVSAAGAILVPVTPNPIDAIWVDRPPIPMAQVKPHEDSFTGQASREKRQAVAQSLAEAGAQAVVLTAPASLAWLFNIRGGDVARTPLPLGEAIVRADGRADLFLAPEKTTPELRAWLGNDVALFEPDDFPAALSAMQGVPVLVDPASSSAWVFNTLSAAGATIVRGPDPVIMPRATKNATEIEGARSAHRRDGAAISRYLRWLQIEAPKGQIDEITACQKLEGLRVATGALQDLSFDSISGSGPNGAIVHYRVTETTNRTLQPGELFLIDSGGQYQDGTTDITRTVAIGTPSPEMRERYTLVLKGHVALSRVRFPAGTTGSALDVLARHALWQAGLDYDHGTGHGVGSYLGVHEGPHRIAKAPNTVALRPGMVVSNEPGYYKEGAYGIRIENLQVVTPPAPIPGGERDMLGFETLTLAPLDRALIVPALLSPEEKAWVNAYHADVAAQIAPLLEGEDRQWLEAACAPL
ncbi:MAG: aminopeptidase P family protein [Caulobacterales bacterium]